MVEQSLSKFCIAITMLISLWFLFDRARADDTGTPMTQLSGTIKTIRTGETSSIRTNAAQHLFELTRGRARKIDDKTISEITSLLDSPDDSVRYWVARSLGNFGRRARTAAPKLQEILARVDCLQGSKTSASGIRLALKEMGITPAPAKCDAHG